MTHWIETHRGAVPPWQCDVTEHFTIAYYFDRLEEAQANLAEAIGLVDLTRHGDLERRIEARFTRELRKGTSFHVESAALGVETGLRCGHRFVDSANGEVVSWIEDHWNLAAAPLTAQQRSAVEARLAAWNGPAPEPRPEPLTCAGFIPTARGRTKPGDMDVVGNFALDAMVHRFSNASAQLSAAVGMDAAFMQQHRRGFSTFELIMQLSGMLRVDVPYLIETGIAHLGNSSMRMIHRMTDPRTGIEVARLSQFGVNLDLDARRPAPWPDEMRRRAQPLVIPLG